MFVPKSTARNPRRRQRTGSDDSVKPPKAKRQRSILRQRDDSPSEQVNHDTDLVEPVASVSLDDINPLDSTIDSHFHPRSTKTNDGPKDGLEGAHLLVSCHT